MTKPISCLLALLLCLASCSKETVSGTEELMPDQTLDKQDSLVAEPVPEIYLTYTSEVATTSNIDARWLIVHDAYGDILDFRSYKAGETLIFESLDSITAELFVTRLNRTQYDYGTSYYLETKAAVAKGSELSRMVPPSNDGYYEATNTGSDFGVQIRDIPGVPSMTATHTLFHIGSTGTITSKGNSQFSDAAMDLNLYEEPLEYYVTILDGNNQLKYLNFNYENKDITVKYGDLPLYDARHEVFLPEGHAFYLLEVAGFPAGAPMHQNKGAVLQRFLSSEAPERSTQPLAYGYLDVFPEYRTVFTVSWGNRTYSRVEYGKRIEHIDVPDPTFSITDNSRSGFRFQTDALAETATHRWTFSEGSSAEGNFRQTNWYVEAPLDFTFIELDLPAELLSAEPALEVDRLSYTESKLNYAAGETIPKSYNTLTIKP